MTDEHGKKVAREVQLYDWLGEKWKWYAQDEATRSDHVISEEVDHALSVRTLLRVASKYCESLGVDDEDRRRVAMRLLRQSFLLFCKTARPQANWPENLFQDFAEAGKGLQEPLTLSESGATFAMFLVGGHINILDPDFRAASDFNKEDKAVVENGKVALIGAPLFAEWHTSAPAWVREGLIQNEVGPVQSFFCRFFFDLASGAPFNWPLYEAVAAIRNDRWWDGPEALAEEIANIEFKHRTSSVQRLVRNDKIGVFEPEQDTLPPKELADFVSRRIENTLNAALQSISPNIFNENSYEVIVIRDTLASEPRSISVLATGFYDAALALQKNNGTLYPEEIALTNLMNALGAATDELCELDEDAKRRCAILAGYNPRKSVDDLPVEDLVRIPETVADQVSDPARKIIESDVERALSKERPPTKTIRIRLSNWLTTISIWMDRAMKGDKKAKWLADVVKRLREWWPVE